MNKTFYFCLTALLVALSITFSGCNLFTLFSAPEAPEIKLLGNVLYWNEAENSEGYTVHIDDAIFETDKTYYIAEATPTSKNVFVTSRSGNKQSKNSNTVVLNKSKNFDETECLEINLENSKTYEVPSSVNYVKISGTAKNTNITLQNRARDLIIELDNITLSSANGKNCISTIDGKYDTEKVNYTVTFIINGENTVIGGDYTDIPQKPATNSGKYGTNGGEGGCAIIVPNAVFSGKGTLTLNGGKGGKGGEGADSSGTSTSTNGSGGNGGSGGSGIKCANIAMAMEIEGIVKAYGGEGGEGGKAGVNGSIMSGPWVSIAGSRTNGKTGNSGSKYIGNLLDFCGSII